MTSIALNSTWLTSVAYAQAAAVEIPSDVLEFLGRGYACAQWSRRAFDPERKAQLAETAGVLQSLKCGVLTEEERSLREKYASDPVVQRVLDASWTKIVTRLPVQAPIPADSNR
jgi:hypothetical protein